MADNPLEMTPEREQHIRERAYAMWQADGEVHGRDAEYWERARELLGMEESAGSGLLPNPEDSDAPIPGVIVEEASIQENLGEFPDRSADQGDWKVTPMTRQAEKASRAPDAQPTRGDAP